MTSILLQSGTAPIVAIQLVLSITFLLRGHNLPGGGFIGGLLAASAFALIAIAFDVQRARRALRFEPGRLMGFGFLLVIASGCLALFYREPFMTGKWWFGLRIPVFGEYALGTPLLFDTGVYFIVLGMTTLVVLSLFDIGRRDRLAQQGKMKEPKWN